MSESGWFAYINMAIGIIGIVITVLTAPSILHLGNKVRTDILPEELAGFGAGLRALGVFLVLATFMFLLALGITLALIPLAKTLGATFPVLIAVLVPAFLFSFALTLSLISQRNRFYPPAICTTLTLAILTLPAGISEVAAPIGMIALFGTMAVLATGAVAVYGGH